MLRHVTHFMIIGFLGFAIFASHRMFTRTPEQQQISFSFPVAILKSAILFPFLVVRNFPCQSVRMACWTVRGWPPTGHNFPLTRKLPNVLLLLVLGPAFSFLPVFSRSTNHESGLFLSAGKNVGKCMRRSRRRWRWKKSQSQSLSQSQSRPRSPRRRRPQRRRRRRRRPPKSISETCRAFKQGIKMVGIVKVTRIVANFQI
jgi:hypothetical protein